MFHVTIRGRQTVTPSLTSRPDGSVLVEYSISVRPHQAPGSPAAGHLAPRVAVRARTHRPRGPPPSQVCGAYKLHVKGRKHGAHVTGSPFALTVRAAPIAASHCSAEGEGLSSARVGETATFTLVRKDLGGRLVRAPSVPWPAPLLARSRPHLSLLVRARRSRRERLASS